MLNQKGIVSAYTKHILNCMIKNDVHFTIATGRSPATAFRLLQGIEMRLPMALLNGTIEWEPKESAFSYVSSWGRDTAKFIQRSAEQLGMEGFWFVLKNQKVFLQHRGELTDGEHTFFCHGFEDVSLIEPFVSFTMLPIAYAMFINKKKELLLRLQCIVEKRENIQTDLFPDLQAPDIWCLDIFDKNCHKGTFAKKMRKYADFDLLVGFGDAFNDHALFDQCDIRCAMENADLSLKKRADYVLASNSKDGVAEFLQLYAANIYKLGKCMGRKGQVDG